MQISSISQDYIIDFLTSAKDHGTNEEFISAVRKQLVRMAYDPSITKIMHGSDNDLCVIKSVLKFSFLNFVDTARVDVEIRKQQNIRGLATLLKEYLGEYMSKDYQVSEWRIRPIPQSMLEYARKDSFVLPFLARVMLGVLPEERVKEVVMAGCRQARKNKKTSQPLIKSVQAH
jgi:exosome complex exonuclease RRP6